jgi:hypothetical protein
MTRDMTRTSNSIRKGTATARAGIRAFLDTSTTGSAKAATTKGYEEKAVDGGPSVAGQLRKLIIEASERKRGPILSTIDSAPRSGERRSSRGSFALRPFFYIVN